MITELRIGKNVVVSGCPNPDIFLEGLRKATKNFKWDSRSSSQVLNSRPSEYDAGCYPLGDSIGKDVD
jgi:hypothetical protein